MLKNRTGKKASLIGFTLLELVIVMVVIVVLAVAGVFIPLHSNKLIAAENKMMFDLRYAQQLAISRQVPCGVSFSANSYFVFINNTSSKATDPYTGANYTIDFNNISELKGVSITSTNFGGLISFNYLGVPRDSGNTSLSSEGIITLHYGPRTGSVTIEPNTGQVKIPMKKDMGLSVIEVILAMVIISICALSMASLFQEVLRGSPDVKGLTIATSLSEEAMEMALAEGFNISNNSGSYNIGGQTYNYIITAYNVNSSALDTPVSGTTEYKHINIAIVYGQGSSRNVTLDSLVTNYTN